MCVCCAQEIQFKDKGSGTCRRSWGQGQRSCRLLICTRAWRDAAGLTKTRRRKQQPQRNFVYRTFNWSLWGTFHSVYKSSFFFTCCVHVALGNRKNHTINITENSNSGMNTKVSFIHWSSDLFCSLTVWPGSVGAYLQQTGWRPMTGHTYTSFTRGILESQTDINRLFLDLGE